MSKKLMMAGMSILAISTLTACSGVSQLANIKKQVQETITSEINKEITKEVEKQAFMTHAPATTNTIPNAQNHSTTLNGKTYKQGEKINLKDFEQGYHEKDFTITYDKNNQTVQEKGKLYLFQQQYSTMGVFEVKMQDGLTTTIRQTPVDAIGIPTQTLPTKGTYQYKGMAYLAHPAHQNKHMPANFNYDINFDTKTGKGTIGVHNKNISLKEAPIKTHLSDYKGLDGKALQAHGIAGEALYDTQTGRYSLGIFGPNADEVTGTVEVASMSGFMGGKKQ